MATDKISVHNAFTTTAEGTVISPINLADAGAVRHFAATYNRALRHAAGEQVLSVDIFLGERTSPRYTTDAQGNERMYDAGGWLEHIIRVTYATGTGLTIGAIQRTPESDSEFHS